MVGGILGCIGAAVSYTSSMPNGMLERRVAFMFAKAVLGAACGFLMASCQTWISETTPRDLRGLFLGFYAFNVVSPVYTRSSLQASRESFSH
jgi:MFS family permease